MQSIGPSRFDKLKALSEAEGGNEGGGQFDQVVHAHAAGHSWVDIRPAAPRDGSRPATLPRGPSVVVT